MVTAEAQAAFERALELEAGHPKARFYLASALAQEGKIAEAAAAWRAMPPDCRPIRRGVGAIDQAMAEAERRMTAAAGDAPTGPSQDEIDAAAEMSAEDRDRDDRDDGRRARRKAAGKIRRIRKAGGGSCVPIRCWARRRPARDALARGIAALGADSEEARGLQAFAASLGLAETE